MDPESWGISTADEEDPPVVTVTDPGDPGPGPQIPTYGYYVPPTPRPITNTLVSNPVQQNTQTVNQSNNQSTNVTANPTATATNKTINWPNLVNLGTAALPQQAAPWQPTFTPLPTLTPVAIK
jgi:hypothetical protein